MALHVYQIPNFQPWMRRFASPIFDHTNFRTFSFMLDSAGNVVLRTKAQGTDDRWMDPVVLLPCDREVPPLDLFASDFRVMSFPFEHSICYH